MFLSKFEETSSQKGWAEIINNSRKKVNYIYTISHGYFTNQPVCMFYVFYVCSVHCTHLSAIDGFHFNSPCILKIHSQMTDIRVCFLLLMMFVIFYLSRLTFFRFEYVVWMRWYCRWVTDDTFKPSNMCLESIHHRCIHSFIDSFIAIECFFSSLSLCFF